MNSKLTKFLQNMEMVIKKYDLDIDVKNLKINFREKTKKIYWMILKKIRNILTAKIKIEDRSFVIDQI